VPLDRTFTDSASGRSTARPQLEAMLAFVRDGDSDRPNRSSATTTTVSPAEREDVNPVAARGEVAFGEERGHRRIERLAAGGQPGDLRRGLAPHPASLAVNTWQLNSPPRPEVSAAVGARIAELAVKYPFTAASPAPMAACLNSRHPRSRRSTSYGSCCAGSAR
jgi:hypothetical protein